MAKYRIQFRINSGKIQWNETNVFPVNAKDAWHMFYHLARRYDDVTFFSGHDCLAIKCGRAVWVHGDKRSDIRNVMNPIWIKRNDLIDKKYGSFVNAPLAVMTWATNIDAFLD